MAIVTFYNGAPKDAPKTTMPAHLGANAIIGRSTHSPEQALGAFREQADYIGVPVEGPYKPDFYRY